MLKRINALFGAQDMTVGRPVSALLRFSIPLLIGNFAQQLYSTVDSIIAGRYVGDKALSAIGTIFQLLTCSLFSSWRFLQAQESCAQYYGAKDKEALSRSIGNALVLVFISSLLVMAIWHTPGGFAIEAHKDTCANFDMARSYLTIVLWGALGLGFYNIVSGILRDWATLCSR